MNFNREGNGDATNGSYFNNRVGLLNQSIGTSYRERNSNVFREEQQGDGEIGYLK